MTDRDAAVARIACDGMWYRGTVWVGGQQVCMALNEYTQSWRAGREADTLCEIIMAQETNHDR